MYLAQEILLWYNKDNEKGALYKGGAKMAGKTDYKNKWQAENCERISLVVKKGRKQIIKDFAAERGYTLNGFVNSAIDEKMQRETESNA